VDVLQLLAAVVAIYLVFAYGMYGIGVVVACCLLWIFLVRERN
jgi:hypothetical protein